MIRYTLPKLFSNFMLMLTLVLTACGGGGDSQPGNPGAGGTPPEVPKWPQVLEYRDFVGAQAYFPIAVLGGMAGGGGGGASSCQTCIAVYGIARSSVEMGKLLPDWKTYQDWPVPYNGKLFSELPIDYNNKIAVVLEDLGSGKRYQYAVQKVEESAEAVTITMLKCMVYDIYGDSYSIRFGLLIPKTIKPIQVQILQSGKPTLPAYEPNGLGAC